MVYRQFFCFVNAYRFCKALKVLASFFICGGVCQHERVKNSMTS